MAPLVRVGGKGPNRLTGMSVVSGLIDDVDVDEHRADGYVLCVSGGPWPSSDVVLCPLVVHRMVQSRESLPPGQERSKPLS